ncbi:amino-acid N-acetyltransferase [Moraxellaceae bacterium AER2_44_116]|jgi:amino-acid N-acetyltransferase|nr:amino-acid N-acetyltransferase [Moraxellaceae bacterium]TQC98450.1 amino-acid N-acetyltransferase [Moraxellaceae bacterium AER2_44_116]
MTDDFLSPDTMTEQYVHWFRNSAPYINAHRGKTFVLMFGGEAVNHDNFRNIIHDIALLHSLGIHLVLVHGARPQIDENLIEYGLETPFHKGLRVTTRESLRCVLDAVGSIRLEVEALLSMGLANSPMYGARIDAVSGNFVTAKPYGVREGVDFQLTGEVRSIDTEAINKNLVNHHIVILGPTGYSTTGEVFNLLAEEVAVHAAMALKADKLILLGEKEGIADTDDRLLREMIPNEVDQYLRNKILDSEILRHMDASREACRGGVRRVHIISYARDGALLQELFTRDGSGTLITQDPYEEIRTADIDDVVGLIELLRPLEEEGILVRRSRERLETEIHHFAVIERDGMIVGCAALYPLPKDDTGLLSGEIACVAVHPNYRSGDRGSELLDYLEARARNKGIKKLFVLTTRTAHWFLEQGFAPVSVDDLPKERKALYNFQRNSQVFSKKL